MTSMAPKHAPPNAAPLFCCEGMEIDNEIRPGRYYGLMFWMAVGFVVVAAIASI